MRAKVILPRPETNIAIHRLAIAILCCGLAIHAPLLLSAQKLDAQEILQNTLNLYSSAGYYSCHANIIESVEIYVNSPFAEDGFDTENRELNHQASLTYTRPDDYLATWTIVDGNGETARAGSISTATDIYILGHQYPQKPELTEEPDQYSSLDQTIDYSEFSSKRFTTILRDFLDPAFHDDLLTNDITLSGTRKLGKLRCYVLKVEGYKSMRIWIDRKNFALCQIEYALTQDTLVNESAWLDWKLSQAQRKLNNPDETRINRRINLYRDTKISRPNSFTLVLYSQSIQP